MHNKRKSFIYIFLLGLVISLIYYFSQDQNYFTCIPIKYGASGVPLFQTSIQGQECLVAMDLGSKFQLSLNKEIVSQLDKKPCGTLIGRDIKGNAYETPAYRIASVKIKNVLFSNVVLRQESEDLINNATFWINPNYDSNDFDHESGSIGRGLLEKRNLLLDFGKSRIFMTNDQKRLKREGYDLKGFIKTPLETGKKGAILSVHTDFGKLCFVIDTGSTTSFLRTSVLPKEQSIDGRKYDLPFVITSQFTIEKKDFGPLDLCLFNITSELHEFDGLLGMNFLKKHILYLDYAKKTAYIAVGNKVCEQVNALLQQ